MRRAACLLPLLIALPALPSRAEEDSETFTAGAEVGYRSVSVDGNMDKYREDVNLSDNAFRLFELDLSWRPQGSTWLDELTLDAEGIGGEPYASARFGMRKAGRYDLRASFRTSVYYYHDDGYFFREAGDLHTWDAERTFYDLDFRYKLADWVTLRAGADTVDRGWRSTTSRDIQRNVFELQQPLDQKSSAYWIGADFRFGWANLTLEQRFASYTNRWLLTAPSEEGIDPAGSTLDSYQQLQVQDADAPVSRILFSGQPLDWLGFSASYARVRARLDFNVDGAWSGLDYDDSPAGNPPEPYSTTLGNTGAVDRASDIWSADATFSVLKNLDLTVIYSLWSYDQDGSLDLAETQAGGKEAGTIVVQGQVKDQLTISRYGFTANWQATSTLGFSAGVGWQSRTADFQLSGPEVETTRTTYGAGMRWRPSPVWDLHLQAERSTTNNPYTPISPTDIDRLRADLRVRPTKTLSLAFRGLDETSRNDLTYPLGKPTTDEPPATSLYTAQFDVTSWGATVDWSPARTVTLALSYDRTDVGSNADIVYVTGYTLSPVFDVFTHLAQTGYVSDQEAIQGDVRLQFGKGWSAFALLALVSNTGTFPLSFDRYGAEGRYDHPSGWHVRIAWDRYDLDEDNPYAGPPSSPTPHVNNYDADLLTLAFGYRF